MTLSDLIEFIGILLAIIAFIGEKERQFVINKFNKFDVLLMTIIFLLINFLLFYNWWRKIFPILKELEFTNFPFPNTWVYFIVILCICWLFYKIFYSNFPKNNQNRALNYYNQLLQREDFAFLYSLIVKYEKKQLLKINNGSKYSDDLIKSIFLNKDFLFKTSNYNYYLFNKILINNINIEGTVIDNYIESHMKNPNSFIYNSKIIELEQEEFHLLAKKARNLDSLIIYIIRNNLIPLDKLFNFILIFSLNKGEANELYTIILQEVVYKKDNNALKLFFIEYLGHIRKNNHNIIDSFQSISLILIESINYIENISNCKNILQLYLDIILFMIDFNTEEIKRILLITFKSNRNDNSKLLIKKIYDIYYEYSRGVNKELENSFQEIYN